MRQIRSELEREQRVVQVQVFTNVLTQRRVRRQLQQTTMVIGQLQFFGRAQHALAFDAAQLTDLDDKWCAIFTGGQFRTDQCARNADTDAGVWRTTHDV